MYLHSTQGHGEEGMPCGSIPERCRLECVHKALSDEASLTLDDDSNKINTARESPYAAPV